MHAICFCYSFAYALECSGRSHELNTVTQHIRVNDSTLTILI